MAKKLKLMDILLLGVAFIDEALDETVGAGNRAYRSRKLGFWTPPNHKPSALRQNIYRMLSTGYLEKKIINGEPTLTITRLGKQRLQRNFSFFKMQSKSWDGYWRIVIFDISEKNKAKRNILRNKLVELGFGKWQRSIYISPFNIEEDMYEFLNNQGLFGSAYILTSKHKLLGDAKVLAQKIWPLDKISHQYDQVISQIEKISTLPKGKLNSHIKKTKQEYVDVLHQDPCLPKQLLPKHWPANQANKLFKSLIYQIK